MKQKKLIYNACIDCGVTFPCYSPKALRCEKCKEIAKRKASQECMQRRRKPYKISRVFPPRKSIKEILRDLKKYNEKHGTYLSYGQYIALIEKGEY